MLNLKNVTAIAVDGVGDKTKEYIELFNTLNKKINFHKILFFSADNLSIDKFDYIKINKMCYKDFNNFLLKSVPYFFDGDYAMIIQLDGHPLNIEYWNDEFFNYDYIGAPWSFYSHIESHGGNGGFSLRSKKLMEMCKQLNFIDHNEDEEICHYNRSFFERYSCKFSNTKIGQQFSLESLWPNHHNDLNKVFGFHGKEHLQEAKKIFYKNFN